MLLAGIPFHSYAARLLPRFRNVIGELHSQQVIHLRKVVKSDWIGWTSGPAGNVEWQCHEHELLAFLLEAGRGS